MAYLNLLAAVPVAQVEQLRANPETRLRPSLVSGASHLLASWVQGEPLAGLLRAALDDGEPLHPVLWHPLRPPLFHPPDAVVRLADEVEAAWRAAQVGPPPLDDDWLAAEVGRLLRLYRHAAGRAEGVVSALDRPGDWERASRVRLLWDAPIG